VKTSNCEIIHEARPSSGVHAVSGGKDEPYKVLSLTRDLQRKRGDLCSGFFGLHDFCCTMRAQGDEHVVCWCSCCSFAGRTAEKAERVGEEKWREKLFSSRCFRVQKSFSPSRERKEGKVLPLSSNSPQVKLSFAKSITSAVTKRAYRPDQMFDGSST
jgi:hypothetical protein